MSKRLTVLAAFAITLHISGNNALASTWIGGSGNWTTSANWSANTLPKRTPPNPVDADINTGSPQLTGGAVGEANNLRLQGNAALNIATGAQLYTNEASIGVSGAPSITVGGVNSAWVNYGNLTVGYRDHGNNPAVLTIENGGSVSTNSAIIGDFGHGLLNSSGWGVVTVKGANSRLTVHSELRIGNDADENFGGILNIFDGGQVLNQTAYIGYHIAAHAVAHVGGLGDAAASWEAGNLIVGYQSDDATLFISNHGTVTTSSAIIGDLVGALGVAHVSGTWTNGGDLFVGSRSSNANTLNIASGGTVSTNRGFLGDFAGARGIANVNGGGAKWDCGSELRVGNLGLGTLNVFNGGRVSNTVGYVGTFAGSTGTVTVDGHLSGWINSAELRVGNEGAGTMTVTNEAVVTNTVGYVGVFSGSTGTVTVSQDGTWINSSDLIVGYQSAGANRLNVQSSGYVSSNRGFIGDFAGSSGEVVVDNSIWGSGTELRVGNFGSGTLRIQNGGDVTSNLVFIGMQGGSHGLVTVNGIGSNLVALTGDLSVGGVGQGSLSVNNGGRAIAGTGMPIAPDGTLSGNGTVEVAGAVTNHGDVRPGTDVMGALHILGSYTQSSFGSLFIEMDAADSYDRLVVTGPGNITLGGTLNVSIIDEFPETYRPVIGDSFDILSWSGSLSGTFSSIQLPPLPASRIWDTSQLYTMGTISVVSSIVGLSGDFNNDGVVDTADYVRWRKNDTSNSALPNDNGMTTQADRFNLWRSNFGNMSGSGSAEQLPAGVPEPPAGLLLVIGALVLTPFRSAAKVNDAMRS